MSRERVGYGHDTCDVPSPPLIDRMSHWCLCKYYLPAVITACNEVGARLCFTGICDSVNRGVSASVHAGIPPPPGADKPRASYPPLSRHTPLEQTPSWTRYTPWEQTTPPPEQTPQTRYTPNFFFFAFFCISFLHFFPLFSKILINYFIICSMSPPPSSACCEIWATSGRYASYWHAFLLSYWSTR